MTDLEKFKKLFDEIGITMHYSDWEKGYAIDDKFLDDCYGAGITIEFDGNGKFVKFHPSGC